MMEEPWLAIRTIAMDQSQILGYLEVKRSEQILLQRCRGNSDRRLSQLRLLFEYPL